MRPATKTSTRAALFLVLTTVCACGAGPARGCDKHATYVESCNAKGAYQGTTYGGACTWILNTDSKRP